MTATGLFLIWWGFGIEAVPELRNLLLEREPSGLYLVRRHAVEAPSALKSFDTGPVAIFVGIDWRVFGRHEAIRSCGKVNDLVVWFLGEGLPSVDLAHGDLS